MSDVYGRTLMVSIVLRIPIRGYEGAFPSFRGFSPFVTNPYKGLWDVNQISDEYRTASYESL